MNTITVTYYPTAREWLASTLRSTAKRLDGATVPAPTPDQIKREKLAEAQLALIDAQADHERSKHTLAMLEERVKRLGGGN